MIRHSRSFFISLIIHSFVFLTLFFAWKSYSDVEKEEEEKVCLKLSNVEISPIVSKIKEPQVQDIIEEKPKKTIQKKVETVDAKPVVKPLQKEESKSKQIQNAQEIVPQEIPVVKESIVKESVVKKEHFEIQKEEPPLKQEIPEDEYIKVNTQKIAQLIQENLSYPISARRKGITGLVVVKFCLSVDAKVSNIKIVESSSEVLSRAAIKTIEDLSEKFPKPDKEVNLSVPINYSLN
jgi:protein TonB